MDRRIFLKNSVSGLGALFVGSSLPLKTWGNQIDLKHVQTLSFRITDAVKEMVTHNAINKATCYFWIYKEKNFPADCPGPIIFTAEGETINIEVTNDLDENHSFFVPGMADSGIVAPGETVNFSFIAGTPGTYLYYDNLNEPVNRVMGLHGALVIMPQAAVPGNRMTPFSNPTPQVQKLFNDLGSRQDLFPGLAWDEGDPATHTPAFRQYVWLLHAASPVLFSEVGNFPSGQDYPADQFVKLYTSDRYANTFETGVFNRKPHFFTINGQSGHFSHHNPFNTPWRRVGEPVVVRFLNAGLFTHSLHLHANHYYVLSKGNKVKSNVVLVDTFEAEVLTSVDVLIPFRRPPDIPNTRGIGLVDPPLIGVNGKPVYPPVEEFNTFLRLRADLPPVRQSPLCYPMHDHIETTNTSQGANYPLGMISGISFTGDRNVPGFLNFPEYPFEFDVDPLSATRAPAPPIPEDPDGHGHGDGNGGHTTHDSGSDDHEGDHGH